MPHGILELASVTGALVSACLMAPPGAHADTVQPYRSTFGSVDIYTEPNGQIGVNVSDFYLAGDNADPATTKCGFDAFNSVLYRNPELATAPGIHFAVPLPIAGDGHGSAHLGPVQNGTYNVTIYCSCFDAAGNPIGDRNGDPLTPWAVKVVVDGHPTHAVVPLA